VQKFHHSAKRGSSSDTEQYTRKQNILIISSLGNLISTCQLNRLSFT